jgi:hypothetical protein
MIDDGVPFDSSPQFETVAITRDQDHSPEALPVTRPEREILRLLVEHWGSYRKNFQRMPREYRIKEFWFMRGLLIALEATAESVDAAVQVALWSEKLRA